MAHRIKNQKLVEHCGQWLADKMRRAGWLFHLTIHRADGDTVTVSSVTNISPSEGRAMLERIKADGAKVELETLFIGPSGTVERFVPVQAEQPPALPEKKHEVYTPGKGWNQ